MGNLYSVTKGQSAIRYLFGLKHDHAGWKICTFIMLGLSLVLTAVGLAFAQQSGDPAGGRRLATKFCVSSYHGSQAGPQRAPSFSSIAAMKSTTGESLNVFLRTSHPSMPNLILAATERDDIIAYILSLR